MIDIARSLAAARGREDAQVSLRVRGQRFVGWLQSDIERSMETIAGTFSVPITWDWRGAKPVDRQDEVQVLIGDTPIITGYVLAAEPFYNATDVGLRIVGRDRAGDVVKCSALHKGGQWRKAKLDTIVRDLLKPFGVEVLIQGDTGAPIADFKLALGEPALDAISRACRLRGRVAINNGLGAVVITQAGSTLSKGTITGGWLYATGGNVISLQGQGTDENRHSEYICFGQAHAKSQADFDTARQLKARATDPEIKRYTPLVINADGSTTPADLQTLVDHTAHVRRGQAYAYEYEVEGWTTGSTNTPWLINQRVPVWDDIAGYHGTELLITATKFSCDLKKGKVTKLTVKPVEAYAAVPLKSKQKKGWAGAKQSNKQGK